MLLLPFTVLSGSLGANTGEFMPPKVPASASDWMPSNADSFTAGMGELVQEVLTRLYPNLAQASGVCISILIVIFLVRVLSICSPKNNKVGNIVCCVGISVLFVHHADSLITLAARTVTELSDYGRLLIPVMASAMAAQGGITGSSALYAGTMIFDSILCALISRVLLPFIYVFLAFSICAVVLDEKLLEKLSAGIKGVCVWLLKCILYVFTGYIGITGVVSGATDASALKAAKLTISSAVPVVGGILSDASEAVLVTAGLAKNAAGIYGMFAMMAVLLGPFIKIGAHYLMLKCSTLVCQILGEKSQCALLEAFCASMGLLLAMTGSVCVLLMISVVCFLHGVG